MAPDTAASGTGADHDCGDAGECPIHDALAAHEHDWRVDPFVLYPSNPPQQRIVCADCPATYLRPMAAQPTGVKTWPKA